MKQEPCIVIDPGHGGPHDRGACHNGIVEAEYNLEVALVVNDMLRGWPVRALLARVIDVPMDLQVRGRMSAQHGAQLVVSLHTNAHSVRTVRGFTAYHWPGNRLARAVGDAMCRCAPVDLRRNRGASFEAFDGPGEDDDWMQRPRAVLSVHDADTVLVEMGYCSNGGDARAMLRWSTRRALATTVLSGIARWLELLEVRDEFRWLELLEVRDEC